MRKVVRDLETAGMNQLGRAIWKQLKNGLVGCDDGGAQRQDVREHVACETCEPASVRCGKFAAVLSDRQHVINDVIDLLKGLPPDPGQLFRAQIAHNDEASAHHKCGRAAAQDGTIGLRSPLTRAPDRPKHPKNSNRPLEYLGTLRSSRISSSRWRRSSKQGEVLCRPSQVRIVMRITGQHMRPTCV